ncbi:MAG: discoidin domain-containing protein [Planctomycetota bacterium]
MKSLQYIFILFLLLIFVAVNAEAKPIIAGFGAEGGEEHLKNYVKYGLNTQFLCVRIAPQMELSLDENGRVTGQMSDEKRQGYIDRAKLAEKHGIDFYLVTAYFEEYIKQLEGLGGFTKAFVQGPTRYISPGEKAAPGPLEERYWLGQLLCEAKFAAELSNICPNVKGLLVDVEMYAGDMMWRSNSSFDDQTFRAVIDRMRERNLLAKDLNPGVAREKRYEWLAENKLLETYFSIERELVTEIARRFRKEIDAINPDFQLGMLPYEDNWFCHGWIKGLASERTAVLVCSESEYSPGFTPSVPATVTQLKKLGVNFRYMPGLFFLKHSPKQIAIQARRCLDAVDGYWLFTTYSLWQPEPEKLQGAYLIQTDRQQYWDALGSANSGKISAGSDERYTCPGYVLLTNNEYYPGPKLELPLKATYGSEPDVVFFGDPEKTKLFDGAEKEAFSTVAWHAKADQEISVVVDLSKPLLIERLRLDAGHILSYYPSVVDGSIDIMTSIDGKMYYSITTETFLEGRGKSTPDMDYDKLGIRARYIKIVMKAKHVTEHSVWAISELAVWGTP